MQRRPISDQVRAWLCGELASWQSAGLLDDDQTSKILDLYESQAESARRKRSIALTALCGIAALMVGLAVLLLVGYNWQSMTAAAKLSVIFAALLGTMAVGYGLRFHSQWQIASEVVFLIGCLLYGSAIWLVAQIFHINSHYPNGIWVWALGVLPFALCMNTLLLHVLYAGLLAVWTGCEVLDTNVFGPWLYHGWAYVPRAAWTLPLLILPGVLWAYRRRSALAVAIYAPVLAWWAVLQPVAWHWDFNPICFAGLAGALMLLAAEMHRVGSPMAVPYRFYGILIAGGVLVPLSFSDFILEWMRHDAAAENYAAGLVIAIIGAAAMLGVVLWQQRESRRSFADLAARQWFPLLFIALMAGLCFWNGLFDTIHPGHYDRTLYQIAKWTPQVLVPTAAVNLTMIVLALWLMRVGLREDRSGPFAVGVLYFLLWAVLRYVDLFAGMGGMLGASLMFLLCGVGLFAVARFWSQRKENPPYPSRRGVGGEGSDVARSDALTLTLSRRERGLVKAILAVGLAVQVLVLGGMVAERVWVLRSGEVVLLRVAPVDPRDLFRGDYVTLSYDFSRLPSAEIPNLAGRSRQRWGQTVFVPLVAEEDGRHWRANGFSWIRPSQGKYLAGVITRGDQIAFGIESYYVPEGGGREFEEAAVGHKLSAEVSLTPGGRAALRRLHIESPLPTVGPAYERSGNRRWPTDRTYYVRRLPEAKIQINGALDEPEWAKANVERHFVFPWKDEPAPATEFMAFCDRENFYFAFRAEDSDLFVLDKLRDDLDEVFEDRVELYFSCDNMMKKYYCLEIDPRGRVLDYSGSYYRQLDMKWRCEGLEAVGKTTEGGYVIEGRIPRITLMLMGADGRFLCGLYRAEFSHDRSGKPVEQKETLHHRGRKFDGVPPIENWISWIDPKTPEPDFHVPSSLGWLRIEE